MHYQPKSQPKPPTPMENSLAVIIAAVALVFALSFKAIAVVLKFTGKVLGFMLMSMGDDVEEGPLSRTYSSFDDHDRDPWCSCGTCRRYYDDDF